MQDVKTYHIRVRGPVEEDDLNACSPLRLVVAESTTESTLLAITADQAGMVGLIRHLHGQGLVLLEVIRCPEETLSLEDLK